MTNMTAGVPEKNFRKTFTLVAVAIVASVIANPLLASEDFPDQYPASALYSKPVEVIPHVFSAIGATGPPTYENTGHNNLSFIVTGARVVVFNSGAAAKLSEALHDEIKIIPDQPVLLAINENGQGHDHATNLAQVRRYTYDYLTHLREKIGDYVGKCRKGVDATGTLM